MARIIVPTKFNRTGKRVFRTPLDERRVCAPAYQQYWKTRKAAEAEWRRKWASSEQAYIATMAHWIASFVANDDTTAADKYKVTRFLAEQSLIMAGPMEPGSSKRWSNQLGRVSDLSSVEEEAWNSNLELCRKAEAEKDAVMAEAEIDLDNMRRALWREVETALMPRATERIRQDDINRALRIEQYLTGRTNRDER